MDIRHYNIMTSCDINLIVYVYVQIYSIAENLKDCVVNFYLLHRNIPEKELQCLDTLCGRFNNIFFHSIRVPEPEKYDTIAMHGGAWVGEAYFPICAHQLLPAHVHRVLYIDAGDVIFTGDISDFYNTDFDGKALIVIPIRFRMRGQKHCPYTITDLYEPKEGFPAICRGVFNSGAYIMNLDKLRDAELTIDDWLGFSKTLCELSKMQDTSNIYFGDQGFLSAAFVDDLKIYYPSQVADEWYMPYNFCLWYYDNVSEAPSYRPAIVHFTGAPKPWLLNYPVVVDRFTEGKILFNTLKSGQEEWYHLWHKYAICTEKILSQISIED